ncbi:MAG: OsmC family protein [Bacteroidetes bacterium]|nr:OsmC family protein [Bacteroidota bacterium]MDA1120212.1 OsmC family protein [Bacteroidota bacterium]
MKVSTTVNFINDFEYEGVNSSENKVAIDMYDKNLKKALSPTELLLTSLAACAMVDIVIMLKKRKKTIESFRAETSGNRREEHPRSFIDIHTNFIVVSPDINNEEMKKVVDLAVEKYCSVADTIKHGTDLTHSFEVHRP